MSKATTAGVAKPASTDKCPHCSEERPDDDFLVCPKCGDEVCQTSCIAGKACRCFKCEEEPEDDE